MEKWFIKQKNKDLMPNASLDLLSKTKLQILYNRDIVDMKDIESFIYNPDTLLNDVNLMKDFDILKSTIDDVILNNKKVYIVGDYDVDGITSTSIFIKTFKKLGIDVNYKIPHRVNDGYGINPDIVKEIKNEGGDLIITCDNGVQAFEAADAAKELNIDLIVTDHHEIKNEDGKDILPCALGVINPHRIDCNYPYKELCGAGVVFKICVELLKKHNLLDDEIYSEIISFAAMGTVCDVVDLTKENRYIATKGISELRKANNIGLNALYEVAQVQKNTIDTYHIGFIIGPRFNASGRLDTASLGIELLTTSDKNRAKYLANELNVLNEERKLMTEEGLKKVVSKIDKENLDKFIVEYAEYTHESVAGIIAGRIKEKYYRPTIIFTDAKEGLKGSARSIENFNIYDALTNSSNLLNKFGGHAMAAGMSIDKDKLLSLKESLNIYAEKVNIDLKKEVYVDAIFPIALVDIRLLDMINSFRPFGKGNPEPLFADTDLILKNFRVFGQNRNVIKLQLLTSTNTVKEVVLFENEGIFLDKIVKSDENLNLMIAQGNIKIDIVYYPKLNDFRGVKDVDIVVKTYRRR